MRDRDRISNLEELMAENLMRLDRLEQGQAELKGSVAEVKYGQHVLHESLTDLNKAVRTNSNNIVFLKENMSTKQGLNNLFEAMMNRFDRTDEQFAKTHQEMAALRQDVEILKAK